MNLEEKLIGNICGNFKIEAYQRGYRWTKDEVEHLLNDINEIQMGQYYCLQPIVVKKFNDYYELIDGQQRLTTIYLIIKNLSNLALKLKYSIEYTTREASKQLLDSIDRVDLDSSSSNIDEFFIKKAYKVISLWFDEKDNKDDLKFDFANKLKNYVSIIWYEVDDSENAKDIFTRLNIGKINLTNAELVKALFLSRGKKDDKRRFLSSLSGFDDKVQHEIALEWDQMEKELHDEKFWAFITNNSAINYPIRMELLFDIIEQKPDDGSNFYTFNKFYEKFKNSENKYATWEGIVRDFQQLKEWYEDFDLYHQIGFLVASGENIKTLLYLATNPGNVLTKSEFHKTVLSIIRDKMIFKVQVSPQQIDTIEYSDLNYSYSDLHRIFIKRLLLLFNVETIRQKKDESVRFPFDRYKNQGEWSLEHIHAQNSEDLTTKEQWAEWLTSHKTSLESLVKDNYRTIDVKDAVKQIDDLLRNISDESFKGSIREKFQKIAPKVIDLLSSDNDSSQMHSLANMALLTVGENAALNNSTFDVKRVKVIDMDKHGTYIPICTRNVFLKYYSDSETKLHFWSEEDRKSYIKAINKILYFGTDDMEIKLINSEIRYGNGQ